LIHNSCKYYFTYIESSGSVTDPQHHAMQPLWPDVSLYVPIMPEAPTTMVSTTKIQQELYLNDLEYTVLPVQGSDELVTNAGRPYSRFNEEDTKENAAAEAAVQLLNNLNIKGIHLINAVR